VSQTGNVCQDKELKVSVKEKIVKCANTNSRSNGLAQKKALCHKHLHQIVAAVIRIYIGLPCEVSLESQENYPGADRCCFDVSFC
jgi:hypothetical protein